MENLKNLRESKSLSMTDASRKAGISLSYYSLIENGFRVPPVRTAKKIARAIGFDWTRFYE